MENAGLCCFILDLILENNAVYQLQEHIFLSPHFWLSGRKCSSPKSLVCWMFLGIFFFSPTHSESLEKKPVLTVPIVRICVNCPHRSSPLMIILRELYSKQIGFLYHYQNGTLCALFLEGPSNITGPLQQSVSQENENKGNSLLEIVSSLSLRPQIRLFERFSSACSLKRFLLL